MILVEGEKYACIQCIRGHRSSSCHHTDRPLVQIRSRGRPTNIETDRVVIFAKDAKHISIGDHQKQVIARKSSNNSEKKCGKNTKLKSEPSDFTGTSDFMKQSRSCCGSAKTSDTSSSSDSVVEQVIKESGCCITNGSYNEKLSNSLELDSATGRSESGSKVVNCCGSEISARPSGGCCSKDSIDESCPTKSTSNGKVIVVRPSKRNLVEIKKGNMKIIESDGISKRHKVSYTLNPVFRSNCSGYDDKMINTVEFKNPKLNIGRSCCGSPKCNCTRIIDTDEDFKKYCHVFKIDAQSDSESQVLSDAEQGQPSSINKSNSIASIDEAQMQSYLSKLSKDSLLYLNNCMCDDNCSCESCLVHNRNSIEKPGSLNDNTCKILLDGKINVDQPKSFDFGLSELLMNFDESSKCCSSDNALNSNIKLSTNNQPNNVSTPYDGMMTYPTSNTSIFKLRGDRNNGNDVAFSFVNNNIQRDYFTSANTNNTLANTTNLDKERQNDHNPIDLDLKKNMLKLNKNTTSLQHDRVPNYQSVNDNCVEPQLQNVINPIFNCFENVNASDNALEMYDFIIADSCTIPGSCACKDDCFCEGCVEHNNNRNKA